MPVVLFRVDDRLIHGQVAVAWGSWLKPDRIVLVNDDVARSEWKREMYTSTSSMGMAMDVTTVDEFARRAVAGDWTDERVIAVFETPADLLAATEAGVAVPEANIGGMHHAEGKREILPYVYVDDADIRALRALANRGTRLEARDVPNAPSVALTDRLPEAGEERGDGGKA
ncbi:MAG: hypothetical protein GF400_03225 [Candidatus Eisenbacteria bacterium]|nr:hypothetical protein [Candidatus Eisenbacteria bacterium]